jgi:hypothetical protein
VIQRAGDIPSITSLFQRFVPRNSSLKNISIAQTEANSNDLSDTYKDQKVINCKT